MKTVLGLSLGASGQDYRFTTRFLGQRLQVQRVGTDGSLAQATQRLRHPAADAVGLGLERDDAPPQAPTPGPRSSGWRRGTAACR